ncbi:MAG: PEGA domain-containing protein [Myxococcales bacterium]|nr:PEGA domain-containing protein [Myxococcales bacterium]
MFAVHALCALVSLGAAPAPAAADDATRAKEIFKAAQKLYKEARYADAIARFEEAYVLKPSPVIIYNIGKCHEQLGDVPKAMRSYRDYLRLAPDAKDKDTVGDAIANLERRLKEKGLQQLLVFADPPAAIVEVDGKLLGNSPASIELTAGNHKLTVKAEGYETTERSFVMQTARAIEMTINLRKLESTPPLDAPKKEDPKPVALTPTNPTTTTGTPGVTKTAEPEKKRGRVWTWVAGGLAVASAGAGVGLGVAAQGTAAKVPMAPIGQAPAQAQQAQGLAMGANVAYGVAGAAAVTAVILFFVEGR